MQKEIIIDGVNVAGCTLFYNAYNENMCARVDGLTCREDDNCYYKQLKRLEQENNSLQAQLNNITVQSNNAITALEQENKELKQKLELDEIQLNSYFIGEEKICKENEKYRKELEEIRKIANKFDYWNNNLPEASEIIGQIKDKIKEALNGNI